MRKYIFQSAIYLCFILFVSTAWAQQTESLTVTKTTLMKPAEITGQWKNGAVYSKSGKEKLGQTRAFQFSGKDIKVMKFRTEKGEKAEAIKADEVEFIVWGDNHILSLPKNFKKPAKGNRFYVAAFHGKDITVFYDTKSTQASSGLNQGEALEVFVLKGDQKIPTKVTKLKFKKQMASLLADKKSFAAKVKNKKFFKYSNMFEVMKAYDQAH